MMGVLEDILVVLKSIEGKLGTNVNPVAAAVAEATGGELLPVGTAPDSPTLDDLEDGEVAVDVNNMPWDSRIHSSSKEKVKDGSWKYRRGVDSTVVSTVEEEYREKYFGVCVDDVPVVEPIAPSAPSGIPALPALPTGLPPAPPAPPSPPVSVEMPVVSEGQEIDDNLIIQIMAATYAKHKVDFVDRCFAKLQMPEDSAAKDIDPLYRWTFYLMATDASLQKEWGLVD